MADQITITASVAAPIAKVWQYWTEPAHIMQWNNASPDWHTPRATNDLREGGTFTARMETKDGSMGFDFGGTYSTIVPEKEIAYAMGDDRKVRILFEAKGNETLVTESFDPEQENSLEMQRAGWQSILDNFKRYAESQ